MLNLHKLNVFSTVAETGSFSKAAEHLYLTQSAVSQHIRDLETQLGTELFVRKRTGVELTPAGEILLDYTKQILWLMAAAENAVTDVANLRQGHLRLGATSTAAVYLLPTWIRQFRQKYQSLRVSLQTDTTPDVIEGLLAGKLDLGFVEGKWEQSPHLHHVPLQDSELYVVVGPNHPWREQERLSIQSLDKQLFIAYSPQNPARTWEDELFARYAVAPMIVSEFDEPEAIKRAVMEGMEAAILPCCVVRQEVEEGRIHLLTMEEQPLKRPIELVWNADRPLKPTERAFLKTLSDQFPQLLALVEKEQAGIQQPSLTAAAG